MVTVPVYERNVDLRPINQADMNVRASPSAFGADVGQGLQQFGTGIRQLGNAIDQVNELRDMTVAKDAFNQANQAQIEADYGPNGYMNSEGKNAVDGKEAYVKATKDNYLSRASSLTPRQQRFYKDKADAALLSAQEQAARHSMSELKTYMKNVSGAHIQTITDQILASKGDTNILPGLMSQMDNEIRQQGKLGGWGEEVTKSAIEAQKSNTYGQLVLRMASDDALKANEFLKANRDNMRPGDYDDVAQKIEESVLQAEAFDSVQTLLGGGRNMRTRKDGEVDLKRDDIVQGVMDAADPAGFKDTTDATADQLPGMGNPSDLTRPGDKADDGSPDEKVTQVKPGTPIGKTMLTQTMNFLKSKGDSNTHIEGLEANFAQNLAAMMSDAPDFVKEGIGIVSAYRTQEEQIAVFNKSDKTGKWAAFPIGYKKPDGTISTGSNHQKGRATDLGWKGQKLSAAPKAVVDWVHANAWKYNLKFPMSWEKWHIEPINGIAVPPQDIGTLSAQSDTLGDRTKMPSASSIIAAIASEGNPKKAMAMMTLLTKQIEFNSKITTMQQSEAQKSVWDAIDSGVDYRSIPGEAWIAAGGIQFQSEVVEKLAKIEKFGDRDDEATAYSLRLMATSRDPAMRDQFAQMNLLDIRGKVSKSTFDELVAKQGQINENYAKAVEDDIPLNMARDLAKPMLDAMGIKPSKDGKEQSDEMIRDLNKAIMSDMQKFKADNAGRNPKISEIQEMLDMRMTPMVWKTKNALGFDSTENGYLFQMDKLPAGAQPKFSVPYTEIPAKQREALTQVIQSRNGGATIDPADIEVFYNALLMAQMQWAGDNLIYGRMPIGTMAQGAMDIGGLMSSPLMQALIGGSSMRPPQAAVTPGVNPAFTTPVLRDPEREPFDPAMDIPMPSQ